MLLPGKIDDYIKIKREFESNFSVVVIAELKKPLIGFSDILSVGKSALFKIYTPDKGNLSNRIFFTELHIYQTLQGDADIPQYLGHCFCGSGQKVLILECILGDDMYEIVIQDHPVNVAKLTYTLYNALTRWHNMGIYHKDIKPENIIKCTTSDTDEIYKIIDFGLGCDFKANQGNFRALTGTKSYFCPLIIDKAYALSGSYTTADERTCQSADLWGLMVTIVTVCMQYNPMDEIYDSQLLIKIIKEQLPSYCRKRHITGLNSKNINHLSDILLLIAENPLDPDSHLIAYHVAKLVENDTDTSEAVINQSSSIIHQSFINRIP